MQLRALDQYSDCINHTIWYKYRLFRVNLKYCFQAKLAFPDHEFPVFVEPKATEGELFKFQWKLWVKLRSELKAFKKEQRAAKIQKKQVREAMADKRLAIRQKLGFVAGSEKKPLNPYLLFCEQTRAVKSKNPQFKDK